MSVMKEEEEGKKKKSEESLINLICKNLSGPGKKRPNQIIHNNVLLKSLALKTVFLKLMLELNIYAIIVSF